MGSHAPILSKAAQRRSPLRQSRELDQEALDAIALTSRIMLATLTKARD